MNKNESPILWFIGCLLLWIIAFPWYLAKRNHYKLKDNSEKGKDSKGSSKIELGNPIKTPNFLAIGCGGLILLIIIVSMINSGLQGANKKAQDLSKQNSNNSTNTNPTPSNNSSSAPQVSNIAVNGDEAYLKLPNIDDTGSAILLATDKKYLDEVTKTLINKDYMGILELAEQNKAFAVHNGSKVLVIDGTMFARRVRILQGTQPVDSDKVGLSGWVPMEWVVKK
ncbi:MAG: hypothetical protein WCP93_01625 [Candidatus Berkelbacteria bacterium]